MNYQDWKESKVSITNLFLDTRNPRVPMQQILLSQQQLIEELVLNDDVYGLAKSIVEMGYFPDERLIVVIEQGKDVVVEGNRRLAALKLLANPDLAPAAKIAAFKTLAKTANTADIAFAKVIIAPSREDAYVLLLNKHTQTSIVKWSLIQQARFFRSMLMGGMSPADISKKYSISLSQIADFIQMLEMYDIACNLELPKKLKEKVCDSRNFPASTLQRLYQRAPVQKFLGIEFDANKKLIGKIDKDEFKKGYSRIIEEIASGTVDSRIVGDNKKIDDYLISIADSKPNHASKGRFTSDDLVEGPSTVIPVAVKLSAHTHQRTSRAIVPSNFKCTAKSVRIKDVFTELRKLHVAEHKNSVAILLRVLLDMSLSHYMEKTHTLPILLEKRKSELAKKNQLLPKDWAPTMHQMLAYILEDRALNMLPSAHKAIQRLISSKDSIYTEDLLNDFVHNKLVMPDETSLRLFWEHLEPIFELTLTEPEKQTK